MNMISDEPDRRRSLTPAQRAEVRAQLAAGEKTQGEIARAFGVSRKTISRIVAEERDGGTARRASGGPAGGTSVYLKPAEREALDRLAASHGFRSRSHLIAHLCRVAGEILTVDAASAAALDDMARQLRGVATNINQMARAANRGNLSWAEDERARMDELSAGCGRLSRQVAALSSQGARKVRAARIAERADG